MKGLIYVYTGDGKGKTTAAIGTAIRAVGHGKRAVLIQFLKKGDYGEIKASILEVYQFGRKQFVLKPTEKDHELAEKALKFAEKILEEKPFLLILDEVNVAVSMGLINTRNVIDMVKKRGETNIILTGRGAPEEFIEIADLVTEMKKIKHPFDEGVKGKEGLEY
ncbi:MAG: cob(I)yrinic acid a,c-diamide adenosyltransferase [Candidatus Thermoplasmatota archaeon]|nr:cob(I)yrinic acid a,c-diamide adenosyltransferase [Candidatus Thermoplasmatota archaeon]